MYDDGGTVQQNPVTQAEVPDRVWRRDYWGKDQVNTDTWAQQCVCLSVCFSALPPAPSLRS